MIHQNLNDTGPIPSSPQASLHYQKKLILNGFHGLFFQCAQTAFYQCVPEAISSDKAVEA
jgi:hypothetical protein